MSKAGRDKAARALIERIRDASGASEDVITHVLEECNYDANEAVARLIECEFPLILGCACASSTLMPLFLLCSSLP